MMNKKIEEIMLPQSFIIRLNLALRKFLNLFYFNNLTNIFSGFRDQQKKGRWPGLGGGLGGIKNVEIQQKVHFKLYIK